MLSATILEGILRTKNCFCFQPLEIPTFAEKLGSSRSTSSSDLRQISLLERLTKTHQIWNLPEVGRIGAVHLLKDRDTGVRTSALTITTLWANSADDKLMILFLFVLENRLRHFMQIV